MLKAFFWTCVVGAALLLLSATPAPGTTEGGGGGGYYQLPACGPAYYGTTLYVLGHYWTCVRGTPDHWRLDS